MAGFFKKALMSMVMDKQARRTAERRAEAKKQAREDAANPKPAKRPMTPERQALIKEALEVRRTQAKVLDELSPEARGKLLAMAVLAMGDAIDDKDEGA